jgi:hypothetical protein
MTTLSSALSSEMIWDDDDDDDDDLLAGHIPSGRLTPSRDQSDDGNDSGLVILTINKHYVASC